MSDDQADDDVVDEATKAREVREMYDLHRTVGRAAMQKALAVIDALAVDAIPVNVAVQLLKFGAELERRSVLGIEPDEGDDPFDALAEAMKGLPGG